MIDLGPQRQPASLRQISAQTKQVTNEMTDYDHGRAAALRGSPRCLGCDPAGTEYPDWYAGWDSVMEARRGNNVANAVWVWLQEQKAIQYVPWVVSPQSDKYDPAKAKEQEQRDKILGELERVIMDASQPSRNLG